MEEAEKTLSTASEPSIDGLPLTALRWLVVWALIWPPYFVLDVAASAQIECHWCQFLENHHWLGWIILLAVAVSNFAVLGALLMLLTALIVRGNSTTTWGLFILAFIAILATREGHRWIDSRIFS